MWKFLGMLVGSFLLLRDFFGYLIPGLAFVALVSPLLFPTDPVAATIASPDWLPIIALIIAGYLAGHVLAAIGYLLLGWMDRLQTRPAQVPVPEWKTLYYRYTYPQIFTETDRRDTIHILRIALGVGLLLGCLFRLIANLLDGVTDWVVLVEWILGMVAGLFMLINAHGGNRHLQELSRATVEAAERAEQQKLPPFSWSGNGDA
jgi:hypothetical protein